MPLNVVAQDLCVTHDCLVIKIEDNNSAKIYHVDSKITITDNSVLVSLISGNENIMLFEQPTLHWTVGVNYLEYISGDTNIKYYPRLNNLVVTNTASLSETTFYGTIPSLIEIKK